MEEEQRGRLMNLAFGHGTPGFWGHVVAVQLSRIEQNQEEFASILDAAIESEVPIPIVDGWDARLTYPARWVHDTLYLIIAVRHVVAFAEKCNGLLKSKHVGAGLRTFRKAAPDVERFRNFIEHIETYVDNRGNEAPLPDPGATAGFVVALETSDYRGELSFQFGGCTLHQLKGTARAAIALAKICDMVAFASLPRAEVTDGGPG